MKFNPPTHSFAGKASVLACSVLMLAALSACGKSGDGQTVGQKLDSAVAKTEVAAADAKAQSGEALKDAAQKAEASGKKAADAVVAKVDDVAITASVSSALAKEPDLSAIKINVDTKDGNVTLTGPAPTASARDKATTLAKAVSGVNSVDNKLVVSAS